jgi:hypothetical protein
MDTQRPATSLSEADWNFDPVPDAVLAARLRVGMPLMVGGIAERETRSTSVRHGHSVPS